MGGVSPRGFAILTSLVVSAATEVHKARTTTMFLFCFLDFLWVGNDGELSLSYLGANGCCGVVRWSSSLCK